METPGVTPGGVSLYCEGLGVVFTGETLQADGPGKIGGEYPDLNYQLNAIGARLFTLPAETRVLAAHGDEVTVGDLEPHFSDWQLSESADTDEGPLTDGTKAAGIRLDPGDGRGV